MQIWTDNLLSGLRDGSKSLLQHLKSFFGPSDPSQPDGQKAQRQSIRPSSSSAPGGDAPAQPGDAFLVAPLRDQGSAIEGGRYCRKGRESELLGERHRLLRILLRGWGVPAC